MTTNLFIGKKIIKLDSVDSTNNYLSNLTNKTNVLDGTVILAQKQTKGKGQRGNVWISEDYKNLTFSVFLNFNFISVENNFLISIMISNSLHELISSYCKNTKIKWPNDIYIKTKKIGGILIENSIQKSKVKNSIIGIGFNVNQLNFNSNLNATSLYSETNQEFDLLDLLVNLCALLEINYFLIQNRKTDKLKSYYFSNLLGYQKEREYIVNGKVITGIITDVKNNGFLELKSNNETLLYDLKKIKFII